MARLVVRADTWFTTPAVVFQPISGLWLAAQAGWPWTTPWIVAFLAMLLVYWLMVNKPLLWG